ncbi:hypothetical protein C8F04DRAFT_1176328 [Mycena alexandri]|uniref:Uncharacterized protein n=1 Tax=Mycena alexandri TaxID=1745969 RepID=A0AAD6T9C7_9AGAR|nr:hypothetical protein C8F04DRAFT_1176328 [Mycena alexandri]
MGRGVGQRREGGGAAGLFTFGRLSANTKGIMSTRTLIPASVQCQQGSCPSSDVQQQGEGGGGASGSNKMDVDKVEESSASRPQTPSTMSEKTSSVVTTKASKAKSGKATKGKGNCGQFPGVPSTCVAALETPLKGPSTSSMLTSCDPTTIAAVSDSATAAVSDSAHTAATYNVSTEA